MIAEALMWDNSGLYVLSHESLTEGRSLRGCSHSARNFDVNVVAFIHGVQTKSSGTINTLIADLFRRWTIRGLWVEDNISGESG